MFIYKSYGAPIQYINCDTMTDHSAEDKEKLVQRQQAYEKRFADANSSKSVDGYIFPSLAMLKAARYTGSVADFSKVLPALVKASFSNDGSGSGVNYGPEIDFILRQARICPTVNDGLKATAPSGRGGPLYAPGSYGDRKDDRFKACSDDASFESMKYVDAVSGDSVDRSEKQPGAKRDLLVVVSPDYRDLWGGKNFMVRVYARALQSDPAAAGDYPHVIVEAHLRL